MKNVRLKFLGKHWVCNPSRRPKDGPKRNGNSCQESPPQRQAGAVRACEYISFKTLQDCLLALESSARLFWKTGMDQFAGLAFPVGTSFEPIYPA